MAGLCLFALGGALLASLPGTDFTLSWTHSIEKTEWREHWSMDSGRLRPTEARIRGTGAGMEPGPDARLTSDGWLAWTPDLPPQESVALAASGFTGDHRLCTGSECRLLSDWTGVRDQPVEMGACR
ncbi:DUF1850 domain-containing protein (plasmid) [Azospirillum humicireducens]|uniref:DUF1850 domain-containing protein n=1 Tax=Azospirillum humicireducens TaxID=1226968 RepID=A0A2R4VX70_9PROT|nr:DUF1850 domain-containing protein [Azospirillum humicireducens]AWB09066.1 DUF1850 domain-containing protein [Azospirillum humicireducens]